MTRSLQKAAGKRRRLCPVVAGLIFVSTIFLGTCDNGPVGNWVVMSVLGLSASVYLFRQGRGLKEIFFQANIKDSSWFQRFRIGFVFILVLSLIAGFVLSFSLWVFLLTSHWVVLLMAVLVQFLFFPLRTRVIRLTDPHFKPHSQSVISNAVTVFSLGLLTAVVMIAGRFVELRYFTDPGMLLDVNLMASHVIDRVQYSITLFQHLARTLLMFELEVLRARGFAEGWFGNLILVYFLLPSSVAAFALPIVHAGICLFCRGNDVSQKAFPPKERDPLLSQE